MVKILDQFLDDEDRAILSQTLHEFGATSEEFWRFWSWEELQLDGDFKLHELQAFVKAMERMAERRAHGTTGISQT